MMDDHSALNKHLMHNHYQWKHTKTRLLKTSSKDSSRHQICSQRH